jgi:hypothetical protein
MAKARTKKAKDAPLTLTTAATVHGKDAYGARFVKDGFSFSADHDLQFALGWPHLYELAKGHPDDADPAASALAIAKGVPTRSVWPEATAHRLARALSRGGHSDMKDNPLPDYLEMLARPEPVTAEEARELLESGFHRRPHRIERLILICEALVGPDAVVQGTLEALADLPPERVHGNQTNVGHRGLIVLGLVLLRLKPSDRDRRLAEWQRLLDGWTTVSKGPGNPIVDVSRAVLAPRDFMMSDGPHFHFDDTAATVAWRAAMRGEPTDADYPDPRHVFLGGDEVYRMELEVWPKYANSLNPAGEVHPVIVERFGRIKSPMTVELMLQLANKSKARKAAKAWLAAHADYARPELERLAMSGTSAEWAQAALASMG